MPDALTSRQGTPPFFPATSGGEISSDGEGLPIVARTETLRFALTLPKGSGACHGVARGDFPTAPAAATAPLSPAGCPMRPPLVKDAAGVSKIGRFAVVSIIIASTAPASPTGAHRS